MRLDAADGVLEFGAVVGEVQGDFAGSGKDAETFRAGQGAGEQFGAGLLQLGKILKREIQIVEEKRGEAGGDNEGPGF